MNSIRSEKRCSYEKTDNLRVVPFAADGYQPVPEQTLPQENNWDYLADQLFGTNEDPNVNGAFPDSVQIDSDEMADFTEESDNYVDPINNNLYLGNGVLSATYGMEQPGANVPHAEPIAAPAIDDLPSAESLAAAALDGAPKVDDIVAPETVSLPSAESLAAAALEGVPTVEDIAAPIAEPYIVTPNLVNDANVYPLKYIGLRPLVFITVAS